jgi:FkbM family methyltransferase
MGVEMQDSEQIIFELKEKITFWDEIRHKYESSISRKFLRRKNRLFNDIPIRRQMVVFADDYVSNKILSFGVYEKPQLDLIFEWLETKKNIFNSTVLDIGANIGNHSLYFSSHFSKCISFEPNPRTFSVLEINSKLVGNIVPMNIGLSDKKDTASLFTNFQNVGASSLSDDWNESIDGSCEIQLATVDDVIGEGEKIGLIKMDVEGHEWFALKGAEKTIANNKPIIVFEHNTSEDKSKKDVIGLLEEYGYDSFYEVVDGWEYLRQYLKRYPKWFRFIFKGLYILRGKKISHRILKINEFTKQQYLIIIATTS